MNDNDMERDGIQGEEAVAEPEEALTPETETGPDQPPVEDEASQPEAVMADEDSLKIEFVGLSSEEQGHKVVLKEQSDSQGEVEMFIGGSEFASIAKELGLMTPPRPLTHDVYNQLLSGLGVEFIKLEIYGLSENAYLSRLHFNKQDLDQVMEIRPSDGIAIALRSNTPIFLNKRLLKGTLSRRDQETLASLMKKVEF